MEWVAQGLLRQECNSAEERNQVLKTSHAGRGHHLGRGTVVGSFATLFSRMVPGIPSVAVLSCRSTPSHAQRLALSFSLPLSQFSLTVSGNHSSGCWAVLLASALFLLVQHEEKCPCFLGLLSSLASFCVCNPAWDI